MNGSIQRIAPQSLEAERSILASVLVSKDALRTALENITAEDFYSESHRLIFAAITDLDNDSEPVDIITVVERLRKKRNLDDVGGITYLSEMGTLTPVAANVEQYCTIVKEKALLREMIATAAQLADQSYSDLPAEEILDVAERRFFELSKKRDTRSYSQIKDVVMETYHQIEESFRNKNKITGLATGYVDLDELTNGLQKSDLIIIAARPSMGKTALCLNIAQNAALRENAAVLVFNLEMAAPQLVHRMVCAEARVNSQRVRKGYVEQHEWVKLTEAVNLLSKAQIYIDDTPGIPIMELRSKARRLHATLDGGLDLIIIDYLQLVTTTGMRSENRQQEIAYITRQLKELARELEIPIIALAQLSRLVEQRGDKRPILSDLRESGEIEQTADIVAFIYRDDYYNANSTYQNTAELIVAKHRNGPIGRIILTFDKTYGRFENHAQGER